MKQLVVLLLIELMLVITIVLLGSRVYVCGDDGIISSCNSNSGGNSVCDGHKCSEVVTLVVILVAENVSDIDGVIFFMVDIVFGIVFD